MVGKSCNVVCYFSATELSSKGEGCITTNHTGNDERRKRPQTR